jgi:acyl-CoA thioesterase FadM
MIALLLDEVSQWTIVARLGKMGLTREISIRYLKPVPTNTEIVVEAKIETQDEKDTVLRSTIRSKNNELLAEGESRWMMANPSVIAKISKVDESLIKEFLSKYPIETLV